MRIAGAMPMTTGLTILVIGLVGEAVTAQVPAAPIDLRVIEKEATSLTFRWTQGSLCFGVIGHTLEGGVLPGQTLGSIELTSDTNSHEQEATVSLPRGIFYVRLYAFCNGTKSPPSDEIRVAVDVPASPSPPRNLLTVVNGTELGLSWVNTPGGGEPQGIVLDVAGDLTTSISLPLTDTFSFKGVPPGSYTLSARATNALGSSAGSAAVAVTFPVACGEPPFPPGDFQARTMGSTASVSWQPAETGSATTSYVLYVQDGNTYSYIAVIPTGARSLSGVLPPGRYDVAVAGVNACGRGYATLPYSIVIHPTPCTYEALFLDDRGPATAVPGNCGSLPCGARTLQVTASQNSCQWTVNDLPGWLQIDGGNGPRSGSVTMTMRVVQNNPTGMDRIVRFQVAGRPISVRQCAGTC